MLAGGFRRLDGGAQVAQVVEGVEDAEHVHAVLRRLLHEGFDHIIGIVAVAEQVLPAQQHLQAGVGQRLAQLAQPLPGVLLEEAQAGVVGRPAPALQRPVADGVELVADGQHVLGAHAGGDQ